MLVLGRKLSETIVITAPDGSRINLMIIEIRGDNTRIGIDAPKEYKVHRGEIQKLVDAEKGNLP